VSLLISQRSSGWAVVFLSLFFSGDGGALQNCVEGRKEGREGGPKKRAQQKQTPKQKL